MSMYHDYDDHLTDSGKDMWSNLFLLVDIAVMVQEEGQRRRGEDDSQKSFFYLFPRKKMSSLVKRRYTQQNPHELRAKKGKSKIVCDDYEYRGESSDDEKRLFEKKVTRFVRNLRRNFDGSSTSSSFLNLRCYKPSMKDPNYQPLSPSSYLTENTTRGKRHAPQQRKIGKFKKAKLDSFTRRTNPETPEWIFQVMSRMKADSESSMLIFEKGIKPSDVESGQSRLLIPFQQLIRNDFLTPGECQAIDKNEYNQNDNENIGVGSILVNQRCEKWGLRFKIWAMEKDTGHGTLNYALNWGWNEVVKDNNLKERGTRLVFGVSSGMEYSALLLRHTKLLIMFSFVSRN